MQEWTAKALIEYTGPGAFGFQSDNFSIIFNMGKCYRVLIEIVV
jgi:hypothetical protein